MSVALRVFFAIVLVCFFGISAGKLPSIKDCKKGKHGVIDCRGIGFQNIPYDIFSISKVKIYLSGNPLICDCSFVWFLREPSENKKRIVDYNSMKCANSKMKGYLIKKITRESQICKTKQYKTKDYCYQRFYFWRCGHTPPPRIPYDIFTSGGMAVELVDEYKCDCDTVWFIRHLRTPGATSRFFNHRHIFCKLITPNGFPTRSPAYDVPEARICPQKANDRCKLNPCPAKVTTCKNTAKSYECIYVDECSRKGSCKSPEVCVNKIKTGYECRCPKELVRDKASKKCVDRDPCKRNENLCPSTTKCETVQSSSGTSHRCVDIDECSTGKYKCGDKEECYNKENGYECRCVEGYGRKDGKCIAIDPCKANPPVCDNKTQQCVSTNWTSYECLDIDECLTQKHDCDKNAKCINTKPGFKCQCQPGFKEYNNGRECKDLDECSDNFFCSKNAKCTNLFGSYKCQCNPGYSGDGKSCKDVNECLQKRFKCPAHSKCHNTRGSYTCKCYHGFEVKSRRCFDVDECKVNSHNCDKNALCINSVGSFECRCKDGFKHLMNGRLCVKEGETSENKNTLIILAVSVSLLFIIVVISCCIYWQRRNTMKGKQNGREEVRKLLGDQNSQD